MLVTQAAQRPRKRAARERARIGLAVAGGGPIGGMYELGALRALDEVVEGLDLTDVDVYVGVSSGAFLAAGLVNKLDTAEICRIFLTGESHEARFRPEMFARPAVFEYLRRAAHAPRMLAEWFGAIAKNPLDINLSDALMRVGSLLPTGLFENTAVEQFLRQVFTSGARSNDFRELARPLYVIAVELDSGREVRFGAAGHDDVPISEAIVASAALPGLYAPVQIKGKYYVDGALQRTLHASVALDQGAELVIGLNPLVPFDAMLARGTGKNAPASLVQGGLPAVLSQTFRTLLQSRMQASLSRYARHYDSADVLLFEPNADEIDMFFSNVFSYANRQHVAELAYRSTLADLRARRAQLAPILARHGLRLRDEVLDDTQRTLLAGLTQKPSRKTAATARLRRALDDLGTLVENRAVPKQKTKPRRSAPRVAARPVSAKVRKPAR
jgi:predicted acylesterase/phospholipase RssA